MKKALVVSGGGSRGAFAVGVIKYLSQTFALEYDVFVGTSTGSLVVPLAALGKLDALQDLYTSTNTSDIIIKDNLGNRLSENSIFRVTPLWERIKSIYTDDFYEELMQSGKEIYINTTCLQSEELVVFTNAASPKESKYYRTKKIINGDHFRKAVLASACQPVFMTPVMVNLNVPGEENPGFQFVDGGVREYAGVEMAINAGAEEIFTILLASTNPGINKEEFKTIFPILSQTMDIFITDVGDNDLIIPHQYNQALKYIDAVKKKMQSEGISLDDIKHYFNTEEIDNPFENKVPLLIHIIQPDSPLGGGPGGLDFIPAEMKGMLAKGEMTAENYVASLNPGDVDWA